MTVILIPALLGLAVASGWAGDRTLARSAWVQVQPAKALWAWHGLAATFLGSLAVAAVLIAHDVLERVLMTVTTVPKDQLHEAYAGPRQVDGLWNLSVLLVVALVVLSIHRSRQHRQRSLALRAQVEQLVHRRHRSRFGEIEISPSSELYAFTFSLGGRQRSRPSVVVSEALLTRLPAAQLDAVLAHEFSHVRRRHHRHIAFAEVVGESVRPFVALTSYVEQMRRLVEMHADDEAASVTSDSTVARALVEMSDVRTLGLAMAGGATTARIERLLVRRDRPSSNRHASWAVGMLAGLTLIPPASLVAPLLLVL